jgi:hypothetical protein
MKYQWMKDEKTKSTFVFGKSFLEDVDMSNRAN